MKKGASILFYSLIGFVAIALIAICVIVLFPSLMINNKSIQWAEGLYLNKSTSLRKEAFNFKIGRIEGLSYRIQLDALGVEYEDIESDLRLELKSLKLDADLSLLDLLSADSIPTYLASVQRASSQIEEFDISSNSSGQAFSAKGEFDLELSEKRVEALLTTTRLVLPVEGLDIENLRLEAVSVSNQEAWPVQSKLSFDFGLKDLLSSGRLRFHSEGFSLEQANPSGTLEISADAQSAKLQLESKVQLAGSQIFMQPSLKWVDEEDGRQVDLAIEACRSVLDNFEKFELSCESRIQIKRAKQFSFPEVYNGPLRASGKLFEGSIFESLDIDYQLRDDSEKLIDARIRLGASGDLLSLDPQKFELSYDLSILLKEFQLAKDLLQAMGVLVPAPISSLRGSVQIGGQGQYSDLEDRLPLEVRADLKSKNQSILSNMKGFLRPLKDQESWLLNIEVEFEELQLIFPQLSSPSVPHLFMDSRFYQTDQEKQAAAKKEKAQILEVIPQLKAKTVKGSPAKVNFSTYLNWVPFEFDLSYQDKQLDGFVALAPLTAKMFRRTARIEKLRVDFRQPREISELSGLIEVDYANYQIEISIEGTLAKPYVGLKSRPPLNRDEIISVLLFGKPPEALDEGQGRSVGNVDAAIASRALTLASMYMFASTPVESVSYDPSREELVAQFRLPGGVSLQLGSDQESVNRVGLRKYLGHGFMLRTEVDNVGALEKRKVLGLLEWFHRY